MPLLELAARVDARNLSCPMPIVKTAQAIRDLPSGSLLEVLATDPGSTRDFVAWATTTGNALVEQEVAGGIYRFIIRRK